MRTSTLLGCGRFCFESMLDVTKAHTTVGFYHGKHEFTDDQQVTEYFHKTTGLETSSMTETSFSIPPPQKCGRILISSKPVK